MYVEKRVYFTMYLYMGCQNISLLDLNSTLWYLVLPVPCYIHVLCLGLLTEDTGFI